MAIWDTGIFKDNGAKLLGGLVLALSVAISPAHAQKKDWEQDWRNTVAAAKKEGQLVISGPSGRVWRDELMKFEQDYPEIKLKITPSASRDFWPRVIKEREVGQYLWDLRVGGPDALMYDIKARGYLVPVRDTLVLPEVVDDSKWHGGLDGLFIDNEKRYALTFAMYEQTAAYYNSEVVSEALSVEDLIDPQWKGKISTANPRGGSSSATLAILYRRYGKEFLKKFFEQDPVVATQWRQQMDWMAVGRHPISIGVPSIAFVEYGNRGLDIDHYKALRFKVWTQGVGGIQLLDKAPHPNAAKVFINWLLTQDVQSRVMKAVNLNSRRKDVPIYDPDSAVDVEQLDQYIASQAEAQVPYHDRVKALLKEVGFQ